MTNPLAQNCKCEGTLNPKVEEIEVSEGEVTITVNFVCKICGKKYISTCFGTVDEPME